MAAALWHRARIGVLCSASRLLNLPRLAVRLPVRGAATDSGASPVVVRDEDIDEKHVRGWGNGGQKLNKTSSCVQLTHRPTGTMVVCQDTRSLHQNRKIAMKRLREKLDLQQNGAASKIGKQVAKLRARKHKRRQRARKKYGSAADAAADDEPCGTEPT
ncbi:hypothetical protein H4R21_000235 [Coemansia helicoidea]|uniref:Uncharacterized protein n=1 Tax=Coemansia helicoidea TaxID=1286919 RepID=A0ACC1LGY7_9FUNG|nr:hypothetical protein H4R21_000235 [Coemansia helicoidea]